MKISSLDDFIRGLPKNARLLDAGCGNGIVYRYIHGARKDVRIFAVDIRNVKHDKFVRFSRGSVEKMPYKNSFFDAIICFHVIEHLNKPERAVGEFYRTLKPNGRILIETPHWVSAITPIGYNFYSDKTHKKPFSKKRLASMLKKFDVNEIRFDSPVYFYLNKRSGRLDGLRKILEATGLYRTVVWAAASKV
jgi:SAM-dependent methyltransferase